MVNDATEVNEGPRIVGVVLRSNAKTVHFIRHAQGTHNKAALEKGREAYMDEDYYDARLTDLGEKQCVELKGQGHGIEKEAQLVLVSPLTRAIQTALLCIDKVEGVPWIALECLRERAGTHPCDRRRNVMTLRKEFPEIDFDLVEQDEDLLYKRFGHDREPKESVEARGRELLEFLRGRPETNIAVVSHSGFLSTLLKKALSSPHHVSKSFDNCELRTVFLDL